MKLKKLLTIVLAGLMTLTSVGAMAGCSTGKSLEELYGNKTFLQVGLYDGGVGSLWLEAVAAEFEKRYEGVKLEGEDSDKEGLKIVINSTKSYSSGIDQILATEERNIFFCNGVQYKSFINKGLLMEITDIVTSDLSTVSQGAETGTIENKLLGGSNSYFNYGGKYYALPFFAYDDCITYDRDLFLEKGFFFRDEPLVTEVEVEGTGETVPVTEYFTKDPTYFSPGPDGVKCAHTGGVQYCFCDDGLPSSLEEFYQLCSYIDTNGCEPLIFTNEFKHYYNFVAGGVFTNSLSAEQLNAYYTYDTADGVTVPIVTGFNGDTPIVEDREIDATNQYDLTQSYAKYLGVSFAHGLATRENGAYLSHHCSNRLDHLKTQSEYVYSALKGGTTQPIAMLIEGSYWYGEAIQNGTFKRSVETYQDKAENRNFAFMPLPWKETGSVEEGQGKKLTLNNDPSWVGFINNNIAGDELTTRLAKEFLQFCYTDWSLKTTSRTANVRLALNYEMTEADMEGMDNYGKSLIAAAQSAQMAYPQKECFYMDHSDTVNFGINGLIWKSRSLNITNLIKAFRDDNPKKTVKEYFDGMKYTSVDWQNEIVK